MLKKSSFFLFLIILAMVFTSLGSVSAESNNSINGSFNLDGVDLSQLKPGDKIKVGDLEIEQFTNEEAAKIISEQSGKTNKEVLNTLNNNEKVSRAARSCATGATAFSRRLNVKSSYKPKMHIWTELCQNSAGQYVVKSIVDITINKSYNGRVKGFEGNTVAKALNNGKTLYYSAEGRWFNNASTTAGASAGGGTQYFNISFNASSTSNYYGYIHQTDNIILFK